MSEPFLSEIRMFSFAFMPRGWAECNGQLLPINQNQALFALLGTQYGGNGQTTFALPDLRGRVPIHTGPSYPMGRSEGSQSHQLSVAEMPSHRHPLSVASIPATQASPTAGAALAATPTPLYRSGGNAPTSLAGSALASVGGSQPHINMQPYGVIAFGIATQGIFPSRS